MSNTYLVAKTYQTIVGVNSWVAHANRSVYGEDADNFRPERWLDDEVKASRMEEYFFAVRRYSHSLVQTRPT